MDVTPIPDDEKLRLESLYRYGILDTETEEMFDDLTQLASAICCTPISLVSLIGKERQWFKSNLGLPLKETSREVSFCSHAILESGVFTVRDALEDPRFSDNPLVLGDPLMRFYAGAPIVTADGFAIGTLCVIDREPRELRPDQEEALKHLAKQIVRNLNLRLKLQKARNQNDGNNLLISVISHDLRAPLCSMVSIHDMLQHESLSKSRRRDELIKTLEETTQKALAHADELLERMQLGSELEPFASQEVDLIDVLKDIETLFRANYEGKNISYKTVHSNRTFRVIADTNYLYSILRNLISNALKFTNPGGSVAVELYELRKRLIISVKDNGRGINPSHIETILSEQYSVSNLGTEGEKGTGMGLSLASQLSRLMGWKLSNDSNLNDGTKAYLTIPKICG